LLVDPSLHCETIDVIFSSMGKTLSMDAPFDEKYIPDTKKNREKN
jgi:hypothetical protein